LVRVEVPPGKKFGELSFLLRNSVFPVLSPGGFFIQAACQAARDGYAGFPMKVTRLLLLLPAMFLFSKASADPLKVGDAAPLVTGVTDTGAKLALADVYKQQPYTLVYFYPKADTPGCTKQGCSLRDGFEALTKKGVAVIGVSHDDVAAQAAFKAKYNLPFTLIADMDSTLINAFGVPAAAPLTSMAHRSAYLIKGGKIVYADYKGTTEKQADTILAELAKPGA
jgi:thioredoxin-dependent peroxiredoxin